MTIRHLAPVIAGTLALVVAQAWTVQAAGSDGSAKLAILNDRSGPYADASGQGSVVMAELAVEDAGGTALGKPVAIVSADHQNKADVGSGIVRRWLDQDGVDAIFDVPNSAVLLAVQEVVRNARGLLFASGGGTSSFTGRFCSPYGFQWAQDTFALANGAARAMAREGLRSWFLIPVDYAFGEAAAKDLETVLAASGGRVVGKVKAPLNTADFSSFLLQAQASGAQVVALLNAGQDTVNSLKQANEYRLPQSGQRFYGVIFFESDARAVGLKDAQGLVVTSPFYWRQSPAAERVSRRFFARTGRMPSWSQIGVYSAVLGYLRAVEAAGSLDRDAVAAKLRALPVEDAYVSKGRVREDGRMMHDMLLTQVRAPGEAPEEWDVFKVLATIPAEEAARPFPKGECALTP